MTTRDDLANTSHEGRHVRWGADPDPKSIADIVERLCLLYRDTNPSAGRRSEAGKDQAARDALANASMLLWPLVSWAAHHRTGQIVRSIEATPHTTSRYQADRKYTSSRNKSDAHETEVAGALFSVHPQRDVLQSRAALASVLRLVFLDWPMAQDLADALEALNEHDVRPILKPPKGKRNRSGKLWEYRKLVLMHVHVRRTSLGMSRAEAVAHVAACFGTSADYIESWDKQLPKIFGEVRIYDNRVRAMGIGQLASKTDPAEFETQWGDEALTHLAALYRREETRLAQRKSPATEQAPRG